MSYYFASNIAAGEQSLRKAISLDPGSATAYIVLGDLLRQTGRFAEAATTLQHAIHLQPGSFAPYYYFGIVAEHLGKDDLKTAIVALRKAVLLNPKFAEAHYELGKCLAEAGEASKAIAELRTSLDLRPGLAGSHYQLGRIYQRSGETQLAREQFRLFAAASEKQHSHDLIRSLVVQVGKPQNSQ
jgi:tetratricopeptide (TPR) repeat protein